MFYLSSGVVVVDLKSISKLTSKLFFICVAFMNVPVLWIGLVIILIIGITNSVTIGNTNWLTIYS